MEKLLVTGGLGFIGSNFILHMLEKYPDYSITNIDAKTYAANENNLKPIEGNPRYKFIHADINHPWLLNGIMWEYDYVVHFAAESHVDNSIAGPLIFTETNVKGTHNLLEAVRNCNVKLKKFIFISSDEVYGSLKKRQRNSKEKDPLKPNSPYSASKAAAEHIVRAYHETYGLPVVITRSSNNFGPRQHPEKLIPKFITNLLDGEKVPLMGDGSNIRDWLYVMDNCEAIDLVMHQGKTGEVYNIGGGNEKTNREITDVILKLLGKDETWIETIPHRLGHDFRYSLNCSKIKNELGWQPKTDFDKGIAETLKWYLDNDWWWYDLKKKAKL